MHTQQFTLSGINTSLFRFSICVHANTVRTCTKWFITISHNWVMFINVLICNAIVTCLNTFLFSYKSLNCAAMVKESPQTKHFISTNVEIAETTETHEALKTHNNQHNSVGLKLFLQIKLISSVNDLLCWHL